MPKINFFYKSAIFSIFFLLFFNGSGKPVIIPDHVRTVVVYYLSTKVLLEVPVTKANIFQVSDHAIVIENRIQRENLVKLMREAVVSMDDDHGYEGKTTMRIEYFDYSGYVYSNFISAKKSYSAYGTEGRLKDEHYKQLVEIVESLKNISDLKFQNRKVTEPKAELPPCDLTVEQLGDFMKYHCGK